VQWQILTCAGSISASKLIWPQWQRPVTFKSFLLTISGRGRMGVTVRITR